MGIYVVSPSLLHRKNETQDCCIHGFDAGTRHGVSMNSYYVTIMALR